MDSSILKVILRPYVLLARHIIRRLPHRLRKLLIRELSLELSTADTNQSTMTDVGSERTGLPVLPSCPAEDLRLAYLKAFMLDRAKGRQTGDRRP